MQIVTPAGISSYANVHRPGKAMDPSKPDQYSLTLLWDEKNPKLAKLRSAIEEVATAKFGAKAKKMLESGQLKNPLRSGGDKDDELYEGKVFLTARSNEKPGIVDAEGEPPMTNDLVYSGCISRMDIWLYAFDKAGNKGVAAILNNVQFLEDGERLSGRKDAKTAFDEADED